jgi:YesN/AraC family two-component response regulator
MKGRVRVLIADDRPDSRDGLCAVLDLWPGVEVIGEATTGQQAVELVRECRPDVVVTDVQMPGLDGLKATEIIKSEWPETRVVVSSTYAGYQAAALAAGADVFLLKGGPTEDLLKALWVKTPSSPPTIVGRKDHGGGEKNCFPGP